MIRIFSQFSETLSNNKHPYSQIESDETSRGEYPNLNGLEDAEANKTSEIPKFMSQILADDEIAEGTSSLNSKQSVGHTWYKDYVKHIGHNAKPIHIFLRASGDRSKSHLVKIWLCIMLYQSHCYITVKTLKSRWNHLIS